MRYKTALKLISLCIVCTGMGFALVTTGSHKLAHTYITMENHNGMLWLNDSDVISILHSGEVLTSNEATEKDLKPDIIKRTLEQNPYIHKAKVYVDANNDVHISISPTEAIVRVINMKGVSYYLSNTGQMLPLSANFTPRVLVATGAILNNGPGDNQNDTALLHTLFFVANKIFADTFLHALTEQLVIDNNNEWTLVPKWGRARIMIGDTQNWDDKMIRLKAFYSNKDKNAQWLHYTSINLKYIGQVVCMRDDIVPVLVSEQVHKITPTDSAIKARPGIIDRAIPIDKNKSADRPQTHKRTHTIQKQKLNHKTIVHE